jgi:hypothetical protein
MPCDGAELERLTRLAAECAAWCRRIYRASQACTFAFAYRSLQGHAYNRVDSALLGCFVLLVVLGAVAIVVGMSAKRRYRRLVEKKG